MDAVASLTAGRPRETLVAMQMILALLLSQGQLAAEQTRTASDAWVTCVFDWIAARGGGNEDATTVADAALGSCATLPVRRLRCDHLTGIATLTPNRAAEALGGRRYGFVTDTFRKVAGISVRSAPPRLWSSKRRVSSPSSASALPLCEAASNAFIVGP